MNTNVRVPLSLHKLTGNKTEFECQGDTVEELLADLNSQYPGIKEILFDEEGKINHSFNLFLNGRIVNFSENPEAPLNDGDEIQIIQIVAGG